MRGEIAWNWTLVTGPVQEPLSINDAKAHLRTVHTREDGLIDSYIQSARQAFEIHASCAAFTQTWRVQLSSWFEECALPMARTLQNAPLASPPTAPVVQYYDTTGTLQTLADTFYLVNETSSPGRIERGPNQVWPSVQTDRIYPIQITYVAGWATVEAIPELVKQGMRLWVASMDTDRLGAAEVAASQTAAKSCWTPYLTYCPDPWW